MGETIDKPELKYPKGGGRQPGSGRKRIKIDLDELERVCQMNATDQEVADFFRVSRSLIAKRRENPTKLHYRYTVKTSTGNETRTERLTFAEVMDRGRSRGKMSIRRVQIRIMEGGKGNAQMAIWLGKTYLGQKESVQRIDAVVRSPRDMTREELIEFANEIPDDDNAANAPSDPDTAPAPDTNDESAGQG